MHTNMSPIFKKPTLADLPAMIAIHCDPRTNVYNPAGPHSPESAAAMLETWRTHWDANGFGYWAVCSGPEDEDEVCGFGGIMRKQVGSKLSLNLYFRLSPQFWGRGLASSIATVALKLAFLELKEPEVLALVRPANLASRRTIERAGLQLHDTTNDVPDQDPSLIYRISREQFVGSSSEAK